MGFCNRFNPRKKEFTNGKIYVVFSFKIKTIWKLANREYEKIYNVYAKKKPYINDFMAGEGTVR